MDIFKSTSGISTVGHDFANEDQADSNTSVQYYIVLAIHFIKFNNFMLIFFSIVPVTSRPILIQH